MTMSDYTLDYTAEEINEKLAQVETNKEDIGKLSQTIEDLKENGSVDFTTVFPLSEVRYGIYRGAAADYTWPRSLCTEDYIKPFIKSVKVISEIYRLAVVIYNNGAYVRTDAWIEEGTPYDFNHDEYQYKMYFGRVDNEYVYNMDECRKSIELTINTSDLLRSYNDLESESNAKYENMKMHMTSLMRRKYDISYANASTPLNLITYVGNNQIVHPKVLYFPEKFARHRFWMAYNPYPWANGYYENPCIAYSDDGYEWTNIPGNPLDDLSNHGGIGVNTDVHLVYVEAKKRLEVWWRYVDKDDSVEVKTETLYRRTSVDGITWTDKEAVLINSSGDTVQHLSPCILHDGSKYRVWVVNDSESTVKYYEGMEEVEDVEPEIISLNDSDLNVGQMLVNGNVVANDVYAYTDKIKLSESKSFSLTGNNVHGSRYHIPIRIIIAYDAEGNRLPEYSINTNIEGSSIASTPTRVIKMDDSVDSVVLTLYKPWEFTNKIITLEGKSGGSSELAYVRDIDITFPDDTSHRLWHIDIIEDNGKTVMLPMCRANDSSVAIEQTWSLFLCTSDDNITFTDPTYVIKGNPYGWDKQIYRGSIVNVDGEYRIYYTAQDEKQRHGLGVCTSNKLSEFVGMI